MDRYKNSKKVFNDLDFYDKQLESRNLKNITHFRPSPNMSISESYLKSLSYIYDTWKSDTKLYKLAASYYGDRTLWWLIGLVNNKPTDSSWKIGDRVKIPVNSLDILKYLGLV